MKVSIGSDHAGFEYKTRLVQWLKEQGHEVLDVGTDSAASTDYPLFIIPAAEAVVRGETEIGIVLGGSGNGEAIAANKVKGVRCALCWNTETAELSRRHNNANVLSIGERMVSFEIVLDIVKIFLSTEFEGDRHVKRLAEVAHYEETGKLPA
jgi:ribose 5-phosphate isomerase B